MLISSLFLFPIPCPARESLLSPYIYSAFSPLYGSTKSSSPLLSHLHQLNPNLPEPSLTMVKAPTSNTTIKFLCSYGGKIVPRHTDGLLRYSGGLTRYLSVDRSISFSELMVKLEEFCGFSVVLRCQLPDGDLETLVTVKSDEDLASIIEEYDRASVSAPRPLSVRAVLSPVKKVSPSSSVDSDCSPRRFSYTAAASTCSSGCCSPQKSAMKVSPTQSIDFSGYRVPYTDAGSYGGRCYSPPVGYPVGLKSEAAKLRYYPFAGAGEGKPRFSYRAPHWH